MAREDHGPFVVADVHERLSGVPELVAHLGAAVEIEALAAGDYAIGKRVVVERKSITDLHETIREGRFWRQVDKLRRACRYPFLLVEGSDLDDGPIPPKAIRGVCVAAITHAVRLIRTADRADSAAWLYALAVRDRSGRNDRPVYTQRPRPSPEKAAEAVLAAIPGISVVSARALLERFKNVATVAAADEAALMQVRGIGEDRARSVAETLSGRPSGRSATREPARQPSRVSN